MNTPNMAVALMPMKRRTKRLPLLSGFLRESRRRAGALAIITGTLLTTFAIAPRGAMAADATPTDDSAYATVNGHIVTKRDVMRRVEALRGGHRRVRQLRVNAPMMYDDETGCHIVMVTKHLQPPDAAT
jgi:hypothetical protein